MTDNTFWLMDIVLKSAALLGLVALVAAAMRKSSAARRHLVWCAGMLGMVGLPLAAELLPRWSILPAAMNPARMAQLSQRIRIDSAPLQLPTRVPIRVDRTSLPLAAGAKTSVADDNVSQRSMPVNATPLDEQRTSVQGASSSPPIHSSFPAGEREAVSSVADWRLSMGMLLPLAWFVGVIVCLAPIVIAWINLRRIERSACPVTDNSWQQLLHEITDRVGLTQPVVILSSPNHTTPMTWGIWSNGPARLLLPESASAWSPERRRIVLLHELAHIRRHDCVVYLFSP